MCTFAAKELLAERRQLAQNFNGLSYVRMCEIDALRWDHENQTGCKCWAEARDEAGPVPNQFGESTHVGQRVADVAEVADPHAKSESLCTSP